MTEHCPRCGTPLTAIQGTGVKCLNCFEIQHDQRGLFTGDWWWENRSDGWYYGYYPMKKFVDNRKFYARQNKNARLIGSEKHQ